jgi:hypothetical protein
VRKTVTTGMLAMLIVTLTALPAAAGSRNIGGTFPNGIGYGVYVDVFSGTAAGSGTVFQPCMNCSYFYSEGTIVVYRCSSTGDCSSRVQIAANRNYNTDSVGTSNPIDINHSYQSCLSVKYGVTSYSNYCTAAAANS